MAEREMKMKINVSKRNDIVTFFQLQQGDTFKHNGYYFMKIPEVHTSFDQEVNAVRLENGWLVSFNVNDTVRYVEAELTIL